MKIDLKSFGIGAVVAIVIAAIIVWTINDGFKERMAQYEKAKDKYEQRIEQLQEERQALQVEAGKLAEKIVKEEELIDSLQAELTKTKKDVQDAINNVDDLTIDELQQFFTNRY